MAGTGLPTLLWAGLVVVVVGFAQIFVGTAPRGRVVGFALLGTGATIVVAAAGPAGSWTAAVTVGATLVPLVGFAAVLARQLERQPVDVEHLTDDDPVVARQRRRDRTLPHPVDAREEGSASVTGATSSGGATSAGGARPAEGPQRPGPSPDTTPRPRPSLDDPPR